MEQFKEYRQDKNDKAREAQDAFNFFHLSKLVFLVWLFNPEQGLIRIGSTYKYLYIYMDKYMYFSSAGQHVKKNVKKVNEWESRGIKIPNFDLYITY